MVSIHSDMRNRSSFEAPYPLTPTSAALTSLMPSKLPTGVAALAHAGFQVGRTLDSFIDVALDLFTKVGIHGATQKAFTISVELDIRRGQRLGIGVRTDSTGLVLVQRVRVSGTRADASNGEVAGEGCGLGAAEKAGIRIGDVLFGVNFRPIAGGSRGLLETLEKASRTNSSSCKSDIVTIQLQVLRDMARTPIQPPTQYVCRTQTTGLLCKGRALLDNGKFSVDEFRCLVDMILTCMQKEKESSIGIQQDKNDSKTCSNSVLDLDETRILLAAQGLSEALSVTCTLMPTHTHTSHTQKQDEYIHTIDTPSHPDQHSRKIVENISVEHISSGKLSETQKESTVGIESSAINILVHVEDIGSGIRWSIVKKDRDFTLLFATLSHMWPALEGINSTSCVHSHMHENIDKSSTHNVISIIGGRLRSALTLLTQQVSYTDMQLKCCSALRVLQDFLGVKSHVRKLCLPDTCINTIRVPAEVNTISNPSPNPKSHTHSLSMNGACATACIHAQGEENSCSVCMDSEVASTPMKRVEVCIHKLLYGCPTEDKAIQLMSECRIRQLVGFEYIADSAPSFLIVMQEVARRVTQLQTCLLTSQCVGRLFNALDVPVWISNGKPAPTSPEKRTALVKRGVRRQAELAVYLPLQHIIMEQLMCRLRLSCQSFQKIVIGLQNAEPCMFGIADLDLRKLTSACGWTETVECMSDTLSDMVPLPCDKAHSLCDLGCKLIALRNTLWPNSHTSMSADELLPLFTAVLVHAAPPYLLLQYTLLTSVSDVKGGSLGEAGYYIATLEAACQNILHINMCMKESQQCIHTTCKDQPLSTCTTDSNMISKSSMNLPLAIARGSLVVDVNTHAPAI